MLNKLYSSCYFKPSSWLYALPPLIIVLFVTVFIALCFMKVDKVVDRKGYIVASKLDIFNLQRRAFILRNNVTIGRRVEKNFLLATFRLDNGDVYEARSQSPGFVLSSDIVNLTEGSISEGAMIATILNPIDLQLKVELDPSLRGLVKIGSPLKYRFSSLADAYRTSVSRHHIIQDKAENIHYTVYADLHSAHSRLEFYGREIDVKLVLNNVSFVDYFLSN